MYISSYRRAMETARKLLMQGSEIIKTKLGDIECSRHGEGQPVLISHGNGGGYDQGNMIAETFLGNGFHTISVSRFGYLRTPLPKDASPAAQADMYASLLDALEIPKAAIIGFSDGGPSALQFAIRHPERCSALVMMAAKSHIPPPDTALQAVVFNTMLRSDFLYWYISYKHLPFLLSMFGISKEAQANFNSLDKKIVNDTVNSMHPMSIRKAGIFSDRKWLSTPLMSPEDYPLKDISAPTLVVHAVDDGLQPFSHGLNTASNIPDAHLIKLESGGHLLTGHIEEIRAEVIKFLSI